MAHRRMLGTIGVMVLRSEVFATTGAVLHLPYRAKGDCPPGLDMMAWVVQQANSKLDGNKVPMVLCDTVVDTPNHRPLMPGQRAELTDIRLRCDEQVQLYGPEMNESAGS